jgi:hypothetical protein
VVEIAREISLEELVLAGLRRADRERAGSRFPPDELLRYANEAIAELRDLILSARGQGYFAKTKTYTLTSATSYDLPLDFYQLVSARIDRGGSNTYPIEPFNDLEEAALVSAHSGGGGGASERYHLRDETFDLYMHSATGTSLVLRYIPSPPYLSSLRSTVNLWGWEEHVVIGIALRVAEKDDESERIVRLTQAQAKLEARIRGLAPKRDAWRPEQVRDVRNTGRFSRWSRRGGF